jgi:hypothetical protein
MQISLQPTWWRRTPLLGIAFVVAFAAWMFDPPGKPVGRYSGRVEAFLYVHKSMEPSRNWVRVRLDAGNIVQANVFAPPSSLRIGDKVVLVSYRSLLFRRITFEGTRQLQGGP